MGYIYLIRNTVNNKCYVGQSTNNARKTRLRDHLSGRGSKLLKKAIQRYGVDAFHTKILHDNLPTNLLDDFEIHEIKRHNSIEPHGYNVKSGGEKGKYHSVEYKLSKLPSHDRGKYLT